MNKPFDTARPGDAVVSFRYRGKHYKGLLRPSPAATWQLLVEGEWWGDLSYDELSGYRLADVDGREQPLTAFDDFRTVRIVPAASPFEAIDVPVFHPQELPCASVIYRPSAP